MEECCATSATGRRRWRRDDYKGASRFPAGKACHFMRRRRMRDPHADEISRRRESAPHRMSSRTGSEQECFRPALRMVKYDSVTEGYVRVGDGPGPGSELRPNHPLSRFKPASQSVCGPHWDTSSFHPIPRGKDHFTSSRDHSTARFFMVLLNAKSPTAPRTRPVRKRK